MTPLSPEIERFRQAFAALPPDEKKTEVGRLYRIVENKPVYYVDYAGKTYKTYSVAGIMRIMETKCGVENPDRSNIHKILRGQRKSLNGVSIYKMPQE